MALDLKAIRKEFESRIKDCKSYQRKALTYLRGLNLDTDSMTTLILQKLKGKEYDAIQYVLNNKNL